MGKKVKVIDSDPILKKNFKYQKRKKERQLQKLRIKQQQQQQQLKMRQLRMIQKKVQENIEQMYQQEKKILMANKKSNKSITKDKSMIEKLFKQQFKNNKVNTLFGKENSSNKVTVQYENDLKKKLTHYQINTSPQTYQSYKAHFQIPTFPPHVKAALTKNKKTTAIMKIQQQIKQQIRHMFSVKKVQDQDQNVNNNDLNENNYEFDDQQINQTIDPQLKKALEDQQKEQQPFILDKTVKVERQVVIAGKLYSISKLAEETGILKLENQNNNSMNNEKISQQIQTASKIINSYTDLVYVQNKEQQTIEDFRKVVINHMYSHQINCFKALSQGRKAKGFTNAKFLIITPYVGDAKAIFDIIQQTFMKDDETNTPAQQIKAQNLSKKQKKKLNLQWTIQNKQKIQQNQNDEQNDFFRVGIKILQKKKKIAYFSNFDSSDIIVASPIGLKSIINGDSSRKQTSFLSSVEILYLDRASVIMMQNWDHLVDIFQNINYMPRYQSLKNSINEIRQQFLDLKARVFKQNIVFTQFSFPQLNSLKINHFHNFYGCVTSRPVFEPLRLENNSEIQKNYFKIQLNQPKDDLQVRFDYFKRKFWDKLHNNDHMKKIVLFVNSYFQFVKLKGFLDKAQASFEAICQHTKKQKIQSRVSRFNNGQLRILLLTERAYYFGLCQIQKQRHIYFYSLPKNQFIYKDMIQSMNGQQDQDDQNKIVCIYSKYDKYLIERIVGSVKAIEMVKEYCTNVSFIL